MEFKDNLQKLRTNSNLTQEQLAEKLFVSRVTVSKWETGRGYPNLESLKLMAKVFGVTVDDLLSTEQLIEIADNNSKQQSVNLCSVFFGLLDFLVGGLFVLPIFVDKTITDSVVMSSLIKLNCSSAFVRWCLLIMVATISIFGVFELALQNWDNKLWKKSKFIISYGLSLIGLILFIWTFQQDPALVLILFLIVKSIIFYNVTKSITKINKYL